MGASGWSYVVPYDPDISAAFRDLQSEVLRKGEYTSFGTRDEILEMYRNEQERVDQRFEDDDLRQEVRQDIAHRIKRLESLPEPTSVDEEIALIREIQAEAGTHSILDMRTVSDDREFAVVSPFSDEELMSLFGTTKPSREIAQAKEVEMMTQIPRWMGRYLVIYEGGEPHQIMFAGVSGD